nr:uncharacterized protein LOC129260668 [Lytechinus pictus]
MFGEAEIENDILHRQGDTEINKKERMDMDREEAGKKAFIREGQKQTGGNNSQMFIPSWANWVKSIRKKLHFNNFATNENGNRGYGGKGGGVRAVGGVKAVGGGVRVVGGGGVRAVGVRAVGGGGVRAVGGGVRAVGGGGGVRAVGEGGVRAVGGGGGQQFYG